MKKTHFAPPTLTVSVVLALSFGAACSKTTEREPAMRPAAYSSADPATGSKTMSGINEISEARCDREVRCGGVGPDKDYKTRDQCIADLNHDGYEDLDADACPRGLDQNELQKCLSEINAERCGAPLDTLERLVACRSAILCKD
jgi:hypothetical protein